jgi:nucleoside-diphosphate-sugar epimerase
VNELAKTSWDRLGSGSEITHQPFRRVFGEDSEETRRRVPSVHRAAEIPGFWAKVPLDEGLSRTTSWFREAVPHNTIDNTGSS